MRKTENHPIRVFMHFSLILGLSLACTGQLAAQDQKKKEPKPEPLSLTTGDGVVLECTWFPSKKGKDAVPIILLHDWLGNKGEVHSLGVALQKLGHAVIAPDMRGHGQSTRFRNPDLDKIDPKKMNKAAVASMVNDITACKRHLIEQNNKGNLNIEKLCLIGTGMSSLLAMEYAVVDWNTQQLPNFKLGRDVRGLIMISPKNSFKGLTNARAIKHPFVRARLSSMIIVGAESTRERSEAKRLHTKLERFHEPLPKSREERLKKQDLFFVQLATNLQGSRLLAAKGLKRDPKDFISFFIKIRLQDKDYPWAERKNPLN